MAAAPLLRPTRCSNDVKRAGPLTRHSCNRRTRGGPSEGRVGGGRCCPSDGGNMGCCASDVQNPRRRHLPQLRLRWRVARLRWRLARLQGRLAWRRLRLARLQWWLAPLLGCLAQGASFHGHAPLPNAHSGAQGSSGAVLVLRQPRLRALLVVRQARRAPRQCELQAYVAIAVGASHC